MHKIIEGLWENYIEKGILCVVKQVEIGMNLIKFEEINAL